MIFRLAPQAPRVRRWPRSPVRGSGDLPLATDVGPARLAAELLPVVLADERTRRPFAQLTGLTALLVGLAPGADAGRAHLPSADGAGG